MNWYRNIGKRLIDLFLALLGLLIASPIVLLSMILLIFSNKGTPFFFQNRPGRNERIFKIIKFKTMNDRRDANGILLSDAERLTKVGKWVRKLSIDELPQLINVIKGDMSLIGPRPLLIQYLPLYNEHQKRRHEVRPGITGWAQVNGRNTISWEQKFDYDVWYVDHLSLFLDIKIVGLTILKVIKREGIAAENQATVEYFKGDES